MTEAIDSARQLIESRLRELEVESAQLTTALRSLDGSATRPQRLRKTGRPTGGGKRTSKKRAPRGRRRQQLLAAVEQQPGASASELAKQIGIPTSQAYALAARLHREGQLTKDGRGYHPSSSAKPPAAKSTARKPRRPRRSGPSKTSGGKAARKRTAR